MNEKGEREMVLGEKYILRQKINKINKIKIYKIIKTKKKLWRVRIRQNLVEYDTEKIKWI